MFDAIIAYSIKQKFLVGLFVLLLIITGLYSLQKLPIDALPDITNNQVQIMTSSPNLATQEIELLITYPIEIALKSIPDIVELRSVSRFGLSIVTVVFEEDVDIYWARSQINERLNQAIDEIPEGYGTPEMGPISTGLGEIYQYTVSAKKGFEDQIDITELRSVQDWIIAPQILGTKGVAEVNTLGGILKEYEVKVNPDRLNSMGVSMSEIFEALHHNNENTGGAYIDKKPNAYFIRSIGMVNSFEDIQQIVIKTENGTPVLIRDVAEVGYGKAIRYGATTKNGEGEVVNGMVMMLKGQNSAEIVDLVKIRMEEIKKSIPEGVKIEPFLDRSKLVNRAISTVSKNLMEGALIVIFILVLLIGNWRAGLIVATVIPLSLLFAISMMRLFGVSGNLMSLGAIDFGLIVDGAIIIVEAIIHRLQLNTLGVTRLSSKQMDEEVFGAASKIRSSAAFGEMIILIVYLPILALVGIEGKMFKPMAQTVSFAILGAFILSLTYVPMMCAWALSKTPNHKKTISDRIISFFQMLYAPILALALKAKMLVLLLAIVGFVLALFTFNSLGGEFIPNLEEGDIATHIIIPPGSSLEQEIETTTKAEKILMDRFPEVLQAVSKIGSAEVPTDPMPMEVADVMIIMKEKSEWTSAKTKEEMIAKMEKALEDLPGVTTEFSQPIQMRFNELMTGVRSDVGVKIFGEDVELLVSLADEASHIIEEVVGVQDCRAEAVTGLKQITIKFKKEKLAMYGLKVSELNQIIRMGFAGEKAGVVYEGEKKFDLVVRLGEPFRQNIDQLRSLFVPTASGQQIPLSEVADIAYEKGPAQISREEGKRRIIIGFNVRNRDVASVVEEIQENLADQIELPDGYYIKYAGQFENLQKANARLSIAVPIALALIFILLYFTFHSIKQSLMIFTAIPLSAIGGVFALWLRDMPFSISAGVGFIALFGVAVLNGIVLISYFNQLKSEGWEDVVDRIKEGTKVRLRPVIMTAAVASLGFLPMALSSSAGAEVQKPLATVVIGGLLTATFLTLVVLPILYYYSEKRFWTKKASQTTGIILLFLFGTCSSMIGQTVESLTLEQAIEEAMKANKNMLASQLNIQKQKQLSDASMEIPKTDIEGIFGQMNTRLFDQSYSISQSFNPYLFKARKGLSDQLIAKSELTYLLAKRDITYECKNYWNQYLYQAEAKKMLLEQASLWKQFADYAALKFEVGETNLLEKTTAALKVQKNEMLLKEIDNQLSFYKDRLKTLMNRTKDFEPVETAIPEMEWAALQDQTILDNNPVLRVAMQEIEEARAQKELMKATSKPAFSAGYFIQSIQGEQMKNGQVIDYNALPRFHGVSLGVSAPIFGRKSYEAKEKAADTELLIYQAQMEQLNLELQNELKSLLKRYETQLAILEYYTAGAIPNADLMVKNAKIAYESGDVSYLEFASALDTKFDIQADFLKAVFTLNQTINSLEYLISK